MRYPDLTLKLQDMTSLEWRECCATSGTSGSLLKATAQLGGKTMHYKASTYDTTWGFYGHECVNELIASRLMDVLGVPHARYALLHAKLQVDGKEHETWITACPTYRKGSETKQAFSQFFAQYKHDNETPLQLCDRFGWGEAVRQMLLVDYLIINQDRHGANVEVLFGKDGSKRLSPMFDCGNSLVFSCFDVEQDIREFDPLVDAIGTNFIGSKRLAENLELMPQGIVKELREEHRAYLFRGLHQALPAYHLDKIWDIIWKRWHVYANL